MHPYTKMSPPMSPTPSQSSVTSGATGSHTNHTSINMSSPTGASSLCAQLRYSASFKRYKYLRRIFKFQQMDFEFALWQMLYLLLRPQKVYKNFQYRKQTKDQWARDDPAFLVLLSLCLVVSSIGFAFVLSLHFVGFLKFILWVVFVDCIGVGLVVATVLWYVTNHYLLQSNQSNRDVEWGYAFDVHLNAFFPLLIIMHGLQLFFLNAFIDYEGFAPRMFGNTLWLIAIGYYIYITFLGYSVLPHVRNSQVLLYPMSLIIILYVIFLITGPNLSSQLMYFYKVRVL